MKLNRREFMLLLAGAGAFGAIDVRSVSAGVGNSSVWDTEYRDILSRIKSPKFRKKDYVVTDFGLVDGTEKIQSKAINDAIAKCSDEGGGRVVIPDGTYFTGAIRLRSNVNLYLEKGAVLKFSIAPEDYLPIVHTRWEGMELMNLSPFIYAYKETNIGITGKGTIDGQGSKFFWKWHGNPKYGGDPKVLSQRPARAKLYEMMNHNVPLEERVFGVNDYLRPQFVQPYGCKNILIEGITILDSPMWEIHPVLCKNVIVRKVRINSHGPNNDGCDPESCADVLIEDCYFDTGDDCIAIKSGRNDDGRRFNVPSENIIVRGCRMNDGHGGITIGSEISGGVRNIFGENCLFDSPNLDHALRVKNNASRGGKLENFYFRNIKVGQVAHSVITIDFNYEEGAKGAFIPTMKNFNATKITSGKSEFVIDAQGFPNAPIENLTLRDSTFGKVSQGIMVSNLQNPKVENVRVNGKLLKDYEEIVVEVKPTKKS